ncbi:MAG: type II secretion system protein M [Deltaproteobacteria bacterium]|nr:type II secretion system protein M [Deltaproteobacteria bacterium]
MASLDQLAPRERAMAIGLGVVFALIVVFLVPVRVSAYLADRQQHNEDLRQAIIDVNRARARIAARRAALGDVAARYANKTPPLGVLVDNAAKSSGLEVAMQTDVPPVPRGKLYTERATKLSVQKTGLKALTKFMETIEQSGHPVAITQFDMSKRIEPDAYTVSMTITAWDRSEAPAPAASAPGGGK